MSFYTISHFFTDGSLDKNSPGPHGIKPEDCNDAVFNYIYKRGAYPEGCAISEELLQKMRAEFEYWYPLDLRCSGKDLIKNHLTMALYNH